MSSAVSPVIWGGRKPPACPQCRRPRATRARVRGHRAGLHMPFSSLVRRAKHQFAHRLRGRGRSPRDAIAWTSLPAASSAVSALKFKLLFSVPRWPGLTDKHLLEREKDGVFIISLYYRCCHFNPSWMLGERLRLGTSLKSCLLPKCSLQRTACGRLLLHTAGERRGKPCSPRRASSSRQHPRLPSPGGSGVPGMGDAHRRAPVSVPAQALVVQPGCHARSCGLAVLPLLFIKGMTAKIHLKMKKVPANPFCETVID